MITAEIALDSINTKGDRITTLILNYPRFIHSEVMTHRVFSRNAASSRAVPTEIMIERIYLDPARPIQWGENQKGMSAENQLSSEISHELNLIWDDTMNYVIENVRRMLAFNPHKQTVNRLLEPWMHIQTLVTSTEWDNFFEQRCDSNAQPEIQVLAWKIRDAMMLSKPKKLSVGEWHIPFIKPEEIALPLETKLKVSTARCARTSYYFHDGKESSLEKDLELHDRLVGSFPIHASPAEHQARAISQSQFCKNLRGWEQYRLMVEENCKKQKQLEFF